MQSTYATGDWFGVRADLAEAGIHFEASIAIDYSKNLSGGLSTGSSFRHLFDANLTFESKLLGYEGGTLFVDFYNHHGEDASGDEVGDIQAFSNVDADGRTQLAELWYEQRLFDDRMRIKLGKIDANADFAFVEHGAEFIHSSPGFSPTILDFPSYPDPAMAAIVFVHPTEDSYLGFGVFDGSVHAGINTGERGPKTAFDNPADIFLIGEAGVTWSLADDMLDGRLGVGGWGHTGTFERFDGGSDDGTAGLYVVLDQMLWRENPGDVDDAQGIGGFFQLGWSDEDVAEIRLYLGVGAQWTGVIPTRDDDVAGVMAAWAELSDDAGAGFVGDREVAIEWFYKAQLTPWFSLKPDLQYIINPGGAGLDNALVFTLRIEALF